LAPRSPRAWALPARGDEAMGKGILLWLIGIPIPIIILFYLFVFH
jgi:hypothetical protein